MNAGTLFAGDVGSPTRAAYTVIGDPVNLAARLMGKAEPGQILAETGVLERSATVFETEAVEPFMVKGKTAPVDAVAVGPVAGSRTVERANELPMFGRTDALDRMGSELAEAVTSGARLIELVGPAGIGKTRLLTEARERARAESWYRIDCERYEQSTSYTALGVLLRRLLMVPATAEPEVFGDALQSVSDIEPTLRPWLPLVASAIGGRIDSTPEVEALAEEFRRDRTHDAILRVIKVLTSGPVVLAFDNAQWLDDNSREVLLGAVGFSEPLPWLICLASRGGSDQRSASARKIELGPLPAKTALELARRVALDQPLPHHRLLEAVERSDGNPTFLIGLVESAMGGGDLPANVEDMVNARIDALGQHERRVLRCAAVIGTTFRVELLETVLDESDADVRDPALWSRLDGFVTERGTGVLMFRQNLHRDVAYAGLPYHLRRDLHRRIGASLEETTGSESPELLSVHYLLAQEYEPAWRYSVLAAERAATNFNHVDAADLYRRAIESAAHLDGIADHEMARIHEALGWACESAGLYDDADVAYATARKNVHDAPVTVARLLRRRGLLRESSGNYSVALRWLTRGLNMAASDDLSADATDETGHLLLAYAGVRYRQGRYLRCIRRAEEVLALPDVGDDQQAHAHYLLCLALAHLGKAESETEGRRALAFYDQIGNQLGRANVLNNLGMNAYYRGQWDESLDLWARSGEAREACGDIVGAATQTNNVGEIYSDQGKLDHARDSFTEALRIWEGAHYGVGIALASSNLGRVEARAGNHDLAVDWLAAATEGFEEIGATAFALEARIRVAENLLFAADAAAAERAAIDLVAIAADTPGAEIPAAILHRVLGCARHRRGDDDGAEIALQTSLDLAAEADAPFERSLTLTAMANIRGDGPDAEAQAIFNRLGVVAAPDQTWLRANRLS